MRWLGLDWDEGPLVGGDFGPYRQSERSEIYADVLARLRDHGSTYDCYCTTDEVTERRKASGSKVMGYDGFCRELTDEQVAAFRAEGRRAGRPVPDARRRDHASTTWSAATITFQTEYVPDFALCRANGDPLYTLVNPVDDALMEITHVLRGEDLLSSHPAPGRAVRGAHRPRHRQGRPRSSATCPTSWARATRSSPSATRRPTCWPTATQGFLPEGLLNYLALLGWAIAPDRDVFTLDEMVETFEIGDVNPNPARFDLKKAEAINADHVRLLDARRPHPPGAARTSRPPASSATRSTTPTPGCSSWRCRWSPSG